MGDPGELEAILLGAPCTLTREQVSERAGVAEDEAREVWVALGFPEVGPGEQAFTERDVQALRTVTALRELGVIDRGTLLVLARSLGQGLSRLAEAQVDAVRPSVLAPDQDATALALAVVPQVLPGIESLVVHVWRRQFAAAVARSLAHEHDGPTPVLAVGFVDLVDFTRSTRVWDATQLERTLERFERDTALRVTAAGGRVVKTLGDEVLFACDDAAAAAQVALATVQAHESGGEDLPRARAGVAVGPVLPRLGDVFGEPVNLASRLVDLARPGAVLVDQRLAEALAGDTRFEVRALHRRPVRGYRSVVPYLVRAGGPEADRPAAGGPAAAPPVPTPRR